MTNSLKKNKIKKKENNLKKTKKNKKIIKHSKNRKNLKYYYGGKKSEENEYNNENKNNNNEKNIKLIKEKIEKETEEQKKMFYNSLYNSELFNKIQNLSLGIALKIILYSASIFQIDLENKEKNEEQLRLLKEYLEDPKMKEQIKNIIRESAEVGSLALEASEPFLEDLNEIIVKETTTLMKKLLDSGSIILGNFIKELPGIGLMFVLFQDIEKVIEAGLATMNASAKVSKEFADFVNKTKENYNILKSKVTEVPQISQSNFPSNNIKNIKNINSQLGGYNNKYKNEYEKQYEKQYENQYEILKYNIKGGQLIKKRIENSLLDFYKSK